MNATVLRPLCAQVERLSAAMSDSSRSAALETLRVIQLMCVCVVGIAVASLVGYLTAHPRMYTWPHADDTPMAFPTALAFALLGTAVFQLATLVRRHFRE